MVVRHKKYLLSRIISRKVTVTITMITETILENNYLQMMLLIYVNYPLLYTGVKGVGLGYRFFHTQNSPHSQPHL